LGESDLQNVTFWGISKRGGKTEGPKKYPNYGNLSNMARPGFPPGLGSKTPQKQGQFRGRFWGTLENNVLGEKALSGVSCTGLFSINKRRLFETFEGQFWVISGQELGVSKTSLLSLSRVQGVRNVTFQGQF